MLPGTSVPGGWIPQDSPARRAVEAFVLPPGEERRAGSKSQGLKSLATTVRPTGVDPRPPTITDRSEQSGHAPTHAQRCSSVPVCTWGGADQTKKNMASRARRCVWCDSR